MRTLVELLAFPKEPQLPVQTYDQFRPKLLIDLDHCHLRLPSTTMKVKQHAHSLLICSWNGWCLAHHLQHRACLLTAKLIILHNMVAVFFDFESFGVTVAPPIESEVETRAKVLLKSTT